MPVRRNSYYNDPAIGKAVENVAGLFAPPSGSDIYAFSKAREQAAESTRLSDFYKLTLDPSVDQSTLDRRGIGVRALPSGHRGLCQPSPFGVRPPCT